MISQAYSNESDISQEIVERILAGDLTAEGEMVQHYQKRLFNAIYGRSIDRNVTEDMMQETWLIALKKLRTEELRNKKSLAGFISQIGRNQLIMNYRQQAKHVYVPEKVHTLASTEPTPEEAANKSQFCRKVRHLLASLPQERDRTILKSFYLDGETKKELCKKHHLTAAHFDRVLYRARKRFKQFLIEQGKLASTGLEFLI